MDFESIYEIDRTSIFIHNENFSRVALQFPDEHLKNATRVVSAIHVKLKSLGEREGVTNVRLFVMADTTYGNCCVDEVGASHVDADCVIHYGHTCLSMTSTLPAFFVFVKAPINVLSCAEILSNFVLAKKKPVVVLYGLEYTHAIQHIKEALVYSIYELKPQFADVLCSVMNPPKVPRSFNDQLEVTVGTWYNTGGLKWNLPHGDTMGDYHIFWIGPENPAFINVMLTFNGCEIVRYDASLNNLVKDIPQQSRFLKRRYYLVEKAKDANIVGILIGTLGVVGYLHMIHQLKELITRAGKKSYTFVMGRPNPAKLANFPECDVFIYVSCAQTALLDSKEYLAPIITPFEALLAFNRGCEWTGAYMMELKDLMTLPSPHALEEARFSFLKGAYIEDCDDVDGSAALAVATERALQVGGCGPITGGSMKSGAEFLANRSYRGLDMRHDSMASSFVVGRSGRACRYKGEN